MRVSVRLLKRTCISTVLLGSIGAVAAVVPATASAAPPASPSRVGGRRPRRAAWPTGAGFLPPPPRTVHAVLSHTAHRRSSPPAFSFPWRHGRLGRGAMMVPLRLISPKRSGV